MLTSYCSCYLKGFLDSFQRWALFSEVYRPRSIVFLPSILARSAAIKRLTRPLITPALAILISLLRRGCHFTSTIMRLHSHFSVVNGHLVPLPARRRLFA